MASNKLSLKNIILPYFVVAGEGVRKPIESMPGVYHLSIDTLIEEIPKAQGIESILLFGLPEIKDEKASASYDENGVVQRAIRAIKKEYKGICVITDVCFCGYTSHGHCRILKNSPAHQRTSVPELDIDRDGTLKTLAKIALSHAEAGADFVAPSAMMEGQVKVIRSALDKSGFEKTKIFAYSAKYASNFYGPFREAFQSAPSFGDRTGYQLNFKDADEALERIGRDIEEGASMVIVKPALAYLDIIYKAKQKFNVPIAAYNVSGEYSMIKTYCQSPVSSLQSPVTSYQSPEVEKELVLEIFTAIKRAGADFIITYWGKDAVRWLG